MKVNFRWYQTEAIQSIWNYFREKTGHPVVAMPTGTGKSVVIAGFCESALLAYPQTKIICLTHVKELIAQNEKKMRDVWPAAPCGIYSAGLNRRDTRQKIIFAGIASVAKRAHEFGFVDLVLIDECDLVSPEQATMYQKFINALLKVNPMLKIVGFSATIWRMGFGLITNEGGLFTDVCYDLTTIESFNRLIAEGYLSPLIPKRTQMYLDTEGVHIQGGEFVLSELQSAVDKTEITYAALREALEYKDTRRHWLVFSSGVEHAIHIAEMLNSMGIDAVAVHSKMSSGERDAAIKGYQTGKYQAIVNNNILTTGFDAPWTDMIICLRPTQSSRLWVQMLGRGTRPYLGDITHAPKQNCLVLDFARNTKRLGAINDPVIPRKKGDKGGDAPVKECPECSCYVHASLRFCNGFKDDGTPCTFEFVFQTKLVGNAGTEQLIVGEMPVTEVFKVDHVTISTYRKVDRPPMMKVSYFCKLRMFEEYVCVEHPGFAGMKARRWLREHLPPEWPIPTTTAQALLDAPMFVSPTHLRVWTNKKHPEILSKCFDGSAFGKEEPTDTRPQRDIVKDIAPSSPVVPVLNDDDIPF